MVLPDGQEKYYGHGKEVECIVYIKNEDFFKKCVLYGDVGFGRIRGIFSRNGVVLADWKDNG